MRISSVLLFLAGCSSVAASAFAGPVTIDCNGNGIDDSQDLLALETAMPQDLCRDAEDVGSYFVYTGSTAGAGNEGMATCANSGTSPDVWYRYRPAADGRVHVSLCGSLFDTVLTIHDGCPVNNFDQIACNDDSSCSGPSSSSSLWFNADAGGDYLIRVSGYGGASGDFTMTLDGPPSVFGASIDGNGNGLPDECERDLQADPHRLAIRLLDNDGPTTTPLVVATRSGSTMDFSAKTDQPWLSIDPASGQANGTTQTLVLTVDPIVSGLGSFSGSVTLNDTASTETVVVPVALEVTERPPLPVIDPGFREVRVRQGGNPSSTDFTVTNAGGGVFTYQLASGASWFEISPATGTLGADESTTHTIVYTTESLLQGFYSTYFVAYNSDSTVYTFGYINANIDPPDCNGNDIDDALDIAAGTSADCNANGIPDECDIANGTSFDENRNDVPDECEPAMCATLPFFDGFESGGFLPHWVASGSADSRVRVQADGTDFRATLDDSSNLPIVLFETDFEDPDIGNLFTVRGGSLSGTDDFLADFQYDYSSYAGPDPGTGSPHPSSIPPAPRSGEGGARALRLEVNQSDDQAEQAAVSVFPASPELQKLDDFALIFDVFMNFAGVGVSSGGTGFGVGTTEHLGAGFAANDSVAIWPNGGTEKISGWLWAMTCDGGSTTDYDYWEASADDITAGFPLRFRESPNWWGDGAGNLNSSSSAWLSFFTSPAYEQEGSPGKEWVTVEMQKRGDLVSLFFTPAAGDVAGVKTLVGQWQPNVTSGANLEGFPTQGTPVITYFDLFNSIAGYPADEFALIDNVAIVADPGNDVPSRSALTLCLDLTGETGVQLGFDAAVRGNDLVPPASNPFLNYADFDGVAMSGDLGKTWYEIQALRTPGTSRFTVNLDDQATSWGLTYGNDFRIRFNEFGNESLPAGGLEIDNVRVVSDSVTKATLDVRESMLEIVWVRGAPQPTPAIHVRNSGGGTLLYSIVSDASIFTVIPQSGTSIGETDTIALEMNLTGLDAGVYENVISVADPMSSNLAETIHVRTIVVEPPPESMGIY